MKTFTFKVLLLAASACAAAATAPASAASIWDGSGATDSVTMAQFAPAPFSGITFPVVSGAGFVSAGGITGTLTSSNPTFVMKRVDQGNGWFGNFPPGLPLLWNDGLSGDISFAFDTPVSGVGALFQTNSFGEFAARLTLSDGSFFDIAGLSTDSGTGAVFVGAQNAVANITSVTFHQQAGEGDNNFAIGDLRLIAPTAVPEPMTWALMILGFAMIGSGMRRERGHGAIARAR